MKRLVLALLVLSAVACESARGPVTLPANPSQIRISPLTQAVSEGKLTLPAAMRSHVENFPISTCTGACSPQTFTTLDSVTSMPVPNAWVFVIWDLASGGMASGFSHCDDPTLIANGCDPVSPSVTLQVPTGRASAIVIANAVDFQSSPFGIWGMMFNMTYALSGSNTILLTRLQ